MGESDLLHDIKYERRRAIQKADEAKKKELIDVIAGKSRKNSTFSSKVQKVAIGFLIFVLISSISLILSLGMAHNLPERRVIIKERIIQPVIQKETITNNITNEYIVKGNHTMTCIRIANETELRCYDDN